MSSRKRLQTNTEVDNNEVTEENVYEGEVLDAKDQELEKTFITHLENLCHCSMLELVPREKGEATKGEANR